MHVEARSVDFHDIERLRGKYRAQADCQIVHDSILPRRLARPWVVLCDGDVAAYGGVWTRYFPDRVVEFCMTERFVDIRTELFQCFLSSSRATEIEAQTNIAMMRDLLGQFGMNPVEEKILFVDGRPTGLELTTGLFRRRQAADEGPDGEWVVESEGEVVAGGGILTHYNPPYGDIHLEVKSSSRRQGVGSYLVQQLREVCRTSGMVPAARCDPDNVASRCTLERGGMIECGRLLAAPIRPEYLAQSGG